jgi:SAM-dependent methyltransferase
MTKNTSVIWLQRENAEFGKTLAAGSRILDAGAGSQQYRKYFAHCVYEAADFELVDKAYAKSNYVCNLSDIPVKNASFDAVIFNQVMEHLPQPRLVLEELYRVLKPGGKMIASAPLFYEEHEQPYDFFRYTQFAWRDMLSEVGFEIEQLRWVEGYCCTVAYQLIRASQYLPSKPRDVADGLLGWIAWPVVIVSRLAFRVLSHFFYALDERQRFTARGYPKNYLAIATKPF